ncbi:MAG: DUF1330 domain-containing protein [Pseudomonadota bacterium]
MPTKVLVMTTLRPDGQDALDRYLALVSPLMEKAGERLVSRHLVAETLSGGNMPDYVSIVDYPDRDAIRMVFEDPTYIGLKDTREAAFSRYDICIMEDA